MSFFLFLNCRKPTYSREGNLMIGQPDILFLTSLWEHCVIGLAKVGEDGAFLDVNPAFCKMLDYTVVELQKMTFQQITHPEDIDDNIEMHNRLLEKRLDSYIIAKRYITKFNKIIWVKLKVQSIIDPKTNEVIGLLSQASPATTVSQETFREEYVVKHASGKDFFKKNAKWVLGFFLGSGLLIYSIFANDTNFKYLSEILLLTSIGGYNFERDVRPSLVKKIKSES